MDASQETLGAAFPAASWHAQVGDATIADSILDRLVHNAHGLELKGESMRRKKSGKTATPPSEADPA